MTGLVVGLGVVLLVGLALRRIDLFVLVVLLVRTSLDAVRVPGPAGSGGGSSESGGRGRSARNAPHRCSASCSAGSGRPPAAARSPRLGAGRPWLSGMTVSCALDWGGGVPAQPTRPAASMIETRILRMRPISSR